ncbi:MAG: MoxR family ATPase, partial [Bacteroidota bacterium]
PLLLKGEPGCGKTRLAKAVAFELYGPRYHNYYFEWNVKSTSKARDGLYRFDYIRQLRDVHLEQNRQKSQTESVPPPGHQVEELSVEQKQEQERERRKEYREFGPLGRAFQESTRAHPSVILIDEVDKADIDFPNDLLLELDQLRFKIEETGEEVEAAYPPIIFITSNDEKVLPPAFLRRCLFHYIDFPKTAILEMIIEANFPLLEFSVVSAAVGRFEKLRQAMKEELNTEKAASTSELIDWIRVINHYYVDTLLQKLDQHMKAIEEGKADEQTSEHRFQLSMSIYDLLTQHLSDDDREQLQQTIHELMKPFELEVPLPSDATFKSKLHEQLVHLHEAEEDQTIPLMESIKQEVEAEFLKHYHTLIKSLTDFKLQVADAKSSTNLRS